MDPQTRGIIERAERRAGALAELTQELLSLARARGGRAAIQLAPVDLAAVAARVIEEQQQRALEHGLTFTVELQLGLPPVLGDAESLADMLANLIGNAIRYTPAGGHVWFRARGSGDRLALEVEDTGIGIAPADRARIFDDFYRAPDAREHAPQGSGLGLAIVKAVVEQHQGSIVVEERIGGGTRFRVELPLAELNQLVAAR
jgi:signal transduction histidine kinase